MTDRKALTEAFLEYLYSLPEQQEICCIMGARCYNPAQLAAEVSAETAVGQKYLEMFVRLRCHRKVNHHTVLERSASAA